MMIAIYYQAKKLLLLTQTHGCKDALPLTRDRPQKKKKKSLVMWKIFEERAKLGKKSKWCLTI